MKSSMQQLFKELYFARTEDDIDNIINNHPDILGEKIGVRLEKMKTISGLLKTSSQILLPH